jgi:hypothetical protein
VDDPSASKTGDKTILFITGNRLLEDSANASVIESIHCYSRNLYSQGRVRGDQAAAAPG